MTGSTGTTGPTPAVMAKVTVAVAEPVVAPVAVMVTVAVDVSVGVPEITPVDGSSTRPSGSVPPVSAEMVGPVV